MSQQQEQQVYGYLIQDSRTIFTLLYDRYILYSKLHKAVSPQELTEIVLKHQQFNMSEHYLIEKYRSKIIRSNNRLKSFLTRFHCRMDEILSRVSIDRDLIKCTVYDNLQLLKKQQNSADTLIRSMLLHPKMETERLLNRSMRNRSLNQLKKPRLELKRTLEPNYRSVAPQARESLLYWSKSSTQLYQTLDIQPKEINYYLSRKSKNKQFLLQQIIERNKSIQSCIKLYKKDFNIHNKILKMKRVGKTKAASKCKKSKGEVGVEIIKNRNSNRAACKPLQVLNRFNIMQ